MSTPGFVSVPSTVEELREGLGGLERLLVAKQWEKAAIVWAWTYVGEGSFSSAEKPADGRMSISEFSRLGITGLRDRNQVTLYRKAWESAHDDGQASLDIQPGDMVELPHSLPWKDHFGEKTSDVQERVAKSVLKDPERAERIMREVAEEDPKAIAKMVRKVAHSPEVSRATEEVVAEEFREREDRRARFHEEEGLPYKSTLDRDRDRSYDAMVLRALSRLERAMSAQRRGEWTPGPTAQWAMDMFVALLEAKGSDDADRLLAEVREYVSMSDVLTPEEKEVLS